jgi:hemolysin activation/secretion protein/AraC-like DNA-binding protein
VFAQRHLILQDLTLVPSGEWSSRGEGWVVVRLVEGRGYWLQQGKASELGAGDVVVALRSGGGVLRASSLERPCKLELCFVDPRLLSGLLTLTARETIESKARDGAAPVFVLPAATPLAQRFAELASQPMRSGFSFRCRLLQLWADAVADPGADPTEPESGEELTQRLDHLLGQMSEAEFAACSLGELAGQLHCSERHFSRVFHEKFGVSFRARQTETRLGRARQLLAESNDKIINIAYESGYRHLGLFNTLFKRRFRMTPSEWRLRARKAPPAERKPSVGLRAAVMLALAWLQCCLPSFGQTNAPPAAPPPERKFEVRTFDVQGNTLLKPQTLEALFADAKGKEVTLEQIRKALAKLQQAYRERGFVTVVVSLPQQQLTNATVLVQVTEAPLVAINVVNNHHYSSNNVMRALPSLYTNMLLNSHVFQRELDLANANRDRQVYPVIGPGAEPGTSELTLKVQDRFPLHGRVDLDNYYTPGTPDLRVNANLQYNNLWDLDHQIGLQYSFSPEFTKHSSVYDDYCVDAPLIANYSGFYRLPLWQRRSTQQAIDAAPLNFGYDEATHQFRMPPPTGQPDLTFFASRSTSDTGVQYGTEDLVVQQSFIRIDSQNTGEDVTLNEGLGGQLSWPLPDLLGVHSTLALGVKFKLYNLTSFNTNNFIITTTITNSSGSQQVETLIPNAQNPHYSSVQYLPFNAGWSGSLPDKLGTSFLNANVNVNVPGLVPEDQNRNFAGASYSSAARAGYVTVTAGFSREQRIYRDWSVMLSADGQWADGPLISNEQFAMGGLAGVRGYLDGQNYGDSGWRMQLEPRTPLIGIGMVDDTIPFWLRGSAFIGYGETYLSEPVVGSGRERFAGTGFGVTATVGEHLDGRLTFAWPLLSVPGAEAGSPLVSFSIGAQF